jgi:hypothetical protein
LDQVVSRRPFTAEARFAPEAVHVGFVVDEVAVGQLCLRVLRFPPVDVISPPLSIIIYHLGDEQ